jgi:chaperone modulatory protein CbpM
MITIETLCVRVVGLDRTELERWIANEWVRPEGEAPAWLFREVDVARVRLIAELRGELHIDEEAMPVVLSLLDQLYATRRQMRALCDALQRVAPEDVRHSLLRALQATEE